MGMVTDTSAILALKELRIQVWGQPGHIARLLFQMKNKTTEFLLALYFFRKSLVFQGSWKSAALHLTSQALLCHRQPGSPFHFCRSLFGSYCKDEPHSGLEGVAQWKSAFLALRRKCQAQMHPVLPGTVSLRSDFTFYLVLVVLGTEFMCVLGKYCTASLATPPALRCHFSSAFSHVLTCLLRSLRTGPCSVHLCIAARLSQSFWRLQHFLQLEGQVYGLSAEISHLRLLKTPQPHTAASSQSTVLGQGRHSVFGTSLYFLYLVILSFPCENVNPCWCNKEKRQENHRFKACSEPAWKQQNLFWKLLFQKSWG